jgi:excinuclease ABC subunit C
VKGVADGDDYAAMYEVLARRFRRGKAARLVAEAVVAMGAPPPNPPLKAVTMAPPPNPIHPTPEPPAAAGGDDAAAELEEAAGKPGTWDLPDLLVVDGGRGQLGVALSAARDLGLHDLPIVGLAKERETVAGEKMVDRVYLPGQKNGIPLRSQSSALFFLARARDEAHRFANHARKKLGKARRLRSDIDDIPGLGAEVKKALLRELGSMKGVREAADERILAVTGVTRRHLTALRKVIPAPSQASAGGAGA